MKRGSTLILKIVIVLITIGALAGLIRFPQTEGRAANLDLISIYKDPFIIYAYLASIPFFVVLYQAFKLLNFVDANKTFSQGTVDTLRSMKFASLSLIGFIILALFYIRFFAHGDDPAGPTALGIIMALAFGVFTTGAAFFQKLVENAIDLRSKK